MADKNELINIDDRINWPNFYQSYVGSMSPAGQNKLNAHCPFGTHQDRHPSFWINSLNGLYKCEACNQSGNAVTFLAHMEHISTGEAYKRLCEMAGIDFNTSNGKQGTYTVKEYALEKRLPVPFLQSLGVKDGLGSKYVEIPYKDEAGQVVATRKRMPLTAKQRFLWNRGAKLIPYGLWRLQDARDAGRIVLVEGESDAQTLWFLGIPALGMPGASTFTAEHAKYLLDIPTIYVHIEPDLGGQTAKRKVAAALLEAGYKGTVRLWSCSVHGGIKDPSALYCDDEYNAAEVMNHIMHDADP